MAKTQNNEDIGADEWQEVLLNSINTLNFTPNLSKKNNFDKSKLKSSIDYHEKREKQFYAAMKVNNIEELNKLFIESDESKLIRILSSSEFAKCFTVNATAEIENIKALLSKNKKAKINKKDIANIAEAIFYSDNTKKILSDKIEKSMYKFFNSNNENKNQLSSIIQDEAIIKEIRKELPTKLQERFSQKIRSAKSELLQAVKKYSMKNATTTNDEIILNIQNYLYAAFKNNKLSVGEKETKQVIQNITNYIMEQLQNNKRLNNQNLSLVVGELLELSSNYVINNSGTFFTIKQEQSNNNNSQRKLFNTLNDGNQIIKSEIYANEKVQRFLSTAKSSKTDLIFNINEKSYYIQTKNKVDDIYRINVENNIPKSAIATLQSTIHYRTFVKQMKLSTSVTDITNSDIDNLGLIVASLGILEAFIFNENVLKQGTVKTQQNKLLAAAMQILSTMIQVFVSDTKMELNQETEKQYVEQLYPYDFILLAGSVYIPVSHLLQSVYSTLKNKSNTTSTISFQPKFIFNTEDIRSNLIKTEANNFIKENQNLVLDNATLENITVNFNYAYYIEQLGSNLASAINI